LADCIPTAAIPAKQAQGIGKSLCDKCETSPPKSDRSCDVAFLGALAAARARRSPRRAPLHQTMPEWLLLCSKDRCPCFGLRSQEGAAPLASIRAACRCRRAHIPFPARAQSILPSCLDHPASCIQNPASATRNETAAYRWSL